MLEFINKIPSFIYAVQIVIAECLFVGMFMPKRNKYWGLWLALCCIVTIAATGFVPDVVIGYFLYLPLIVVLVCLIGTVFAVSDAKLNVVFFCVVAVALMQHTAECFTMIMRFMLHVELFGTVWNILSFICYAVIYTALIFIFRWRAKAIEMRSGTIILLSAVIFLVVFSIRNIAYSISSVIGHSVQYAAIYNTYAFICCLFCIFFMLATNSEHQLEAEKIVMDTLLKREQEHYDKLIQNQDMISRKCHDLKYQLKSIRESTGDEREQALSKMESDIMIYESIAKTGNVALDHTLSDKCLYCSQNDIKFTYIVDAENLKILSAIDIYTLFGNAIDNAIECVMKYEDKEKRIISLYVREQFGLLRIHLENYCEETVFNADGSIATSKADKADHGFGLKSIEYIVQKYKGHLSVTCEKRLFCLDAAIPIE